MKEGKKESRWEERIANKVNFEEYFNVLELLQSYCKSYFNKGAIKEYTSPHRVFTDLMEDVKRFQEKDVKAPARMSFEDVTRGLSYKVSRLLSDTYLKLTILYTITIASSRMRGAIIAVSLRL